MMKRRSIFPLAVGVVVVLGVVAVVLTVFEQRGSEAIEVADVDVAGEPLPAYAPGESDAAIGQRLPTVAGVTPDGRAVSIEPGGRPLAVVVLAHWCPHCQYEVTEVTRWLEETGGVDGVEIAALSTFVDRGRANYPPSRWLEREGWGVPTAVDDSDSTAAAAYGVYGTPFWIFADADGQVVLRRSGVVQVEQLEEILTTLADG